MNKIPCGKRGRISQYTVYPRCVLIAKSVLSKETLEAIDSGSDSVFQFCIHCTYVGCLFIPTAIQGKHEQDTLIPPVLQREPGQENSTGTALQVEFEQEGWLVVE